MKITPLLISFLTLILLNSCSGIPEALKPKPVDAREISPNAKDRVDKNMSEGRGMRLFGGKKSGEFEFANSNPLWRGALETIDFMPLLSVDYGGGIIITDWFNDGAKDNESIKIVVKFLSNEIRALISLDKNLTTIFIDSLSLAPSLNQSVIIIPPP